MQTFLSESTFSGTAEVLDWKRLLKQVTEARQIMQILFAEPRSDGKIIPWSHHPAVLMWKGHEFHLWLYLKRMMEECIDRGYDVEKNRNAIAKFVPLLMARNKEPPPIWWSDEKLKDRIIITHRARLFIKKPEHYANYEQWVEPAKELVCCSHCNYYWPTHISMKKVGRRYVYV